MAERPGQHNNPSLHQASVNQPQQPQRGIPTPQQNFVSSEADNQALLVSVPSALRPSSQPLSAATNALFAPPVSLTTPPAPAVVSCPPHTLYLQPGHREEPSQTQATQTPPPVPTASAPTPRAVTPSITEPSPRTPKFHKGKAAAKLKPLTRRKGSTTTNNIETPTPAHTVASTPTSSTSIDAKGGRKRVRDDDIDAATPGVSSAQSPKRVKPN